MANGLTLLGWEYKTAEGRTELLQYNPNKMRQHEARKAASEAGIVAKRLTPRYQH